MVVSRVGHSRLVPSGPTEPAAAQHAVICVPHEPQDVKNAGSSRLLHVLLLEDNLADAEILTHELGSQLRAYGLRICCRRVDSEAEYLLSLRTDVDLILADYSLPQFDARRALQLLKESGLNLPFIIVTAAVGEDVVAECMRDGADDYLLKDRLGRLGSAVQRALDAHRIQREKEQAEEALKRSEERYRTIVNTASEGIIVTDANRIITYVNPRMCQMLRAESSDLLGCTLIDFIRPEVSPWLIRRFEERRQGLHGRYDLELRGKDASIIWTQVASSPLRTPEGEFGGSIMLFADISDRKKAEQALTHLALHDSLTGLPNRALLGDRLRQAVAAAKRTGGGAALLVLDLDHFKEMNDAYGHAAGDRFLAELGHRLPRVVRESDTVARVGGDQFAVVIPGTSSKVELAAIARKLQAAVRAPFTMDGQGVELSASIGIAVYPPHGENEDALLPRAEVAMDAAKRQHTGCSFYEPAEAGPELTFFLTSDLRHAIEGQQLELFYQPKVDMRTRRLVGVEALARWRHPKLGVIPPDRFIALAEQTDLIKPLSQWAMDTALSASQQWRKRGWGFNVAVNLSMHNLHDPKLPEVIGGLLQAWAAPAGQLSIEVTETAIIADPVLTMNVVSQLHDLGIGFAIDDFGTGYSSLTYLKEFPAQEIKIDKSFVLGLLTNEDDALIVRSVNELAHNLGRLTVAEGVETREHWDALSALGCDVAQGYFVGRPMAIRDLEQWVDRGEWSL